MECLMWANRGPFAVLVTRPGCIPASFPVTPTPVVALSSPSVCGCTRGDLWNAVCGCCRTKSLEILCQSSQTSASASGPHGGGAFIMLLLLLWTDALWSPWTLSNNPVSVLTEQVENVCFSCSCRDWNPSARARETDGRFGVSHLKPAESELKILRLYKAV